MSAIETNQNTLSFGEPCGLSKQALLNYRKVERIEGKTAPEQWANIRPYFEMNTQEHSDIAKAKFLEAVEEGEHEGVRTLTLKPKNGSWRNDRTILYIHGGAFTLGKPDHLLHIPAPVAYAARVQTVCVDYPLAPEAKFPAAQEACYSVYKSLIESGKKVVLMGDSAGGGAAMAVALMARDRGLGMPEGIVAYTPWCDMLQESDSYVTLGQTGLSRKLSPECLQGAMDAIFTNEEQKREPYASPVLADYIAGPFPRTLITTGTRDLLSGESINLAHRLDCAGHETNLVIEPGLWHDYQEESETVESLLCAARAAKFVREVLFTTDETANMTPPQKLARFH